MERFSTVRSGIALAATLIVVFILCSIAQLIVPGAQFSHMWLQLFSAAPMGSAAMWVEGIVASLLVGFVAGWCFAHCYNWSGKHGIK